MSEVDSQCAIVEFLKNKLNKKVRNENIISCIKSLPCSVNLVFSLRKAISLNTKNIIQAKEESKYKRSDVSSVYIFDFFELVQPMFRIEI